MRRNSSATTFHARARGMMSVCASPLFRRNDRRPIIETHPRGAPPSINGKDQMGPGPDWTLVPYANPHYATKFKPMKNIQLIALITGGKNTFTKVHGMFILFRQT